MAEGGKNFPDNRIPVISLARHFGIRPGDLKDLLFEAINAGYLSGYTFMPEAEPETGEKETPIFINNNTVIMIGKNNLDALAEKNPNLRQYITKRRVFNLSADENVNIILIPTDNSQP